MISDLIDKYFSFLGFVKVKGSTSDITPLMPFLLLDIQYSLYQKTIAPIKATGNLKDVRNKWKNAYNHDIDERIRQLECLEAMLNTE